jgi:hypothetical protein
VTHGDARLLVVWTSTAEAEACAVVI